MEEISTDQFRRLLDGDAAFAMVDTRDEESFEAFRVAGAKRYHYAPGDDFDPEDFRETTGINPEETVVTLCAKGIGSRAFADELDDAGYEDARVLTGGMEAWSAVYDEAAVTTDDSKLRIYQLQRRAKGCLGYVIAHDPTDEAVIIDPTRHVGEFLAAVEARGYEAVGICDTHIHADHISGGRRLANLLEVPYYLPAAAANREVAYDYRPLADGDTVAVGEAELTVLHTPGHTSESTSYLLDDEVVFTGDTLFVDSVGRTELQFGTGEAAEGARNLYASLHETLLELPADVTVLPSHFSVASDGTSNVDHGAEISTTVGEAVAIDLLRTDEKEFVARITDDLPEKPPSYERVIAINSGRERPDDAQEAVELELGPNRCAATGE